MAAIVIVGTVDSIRSRLKDVLQRAGYQVLEASDPQAALQILSSAPEHLVAILMATLPEADVEELLDAAEADDRLRTSNTYLLLATDPMNLPNSMARLRDELSVPVVAQPTDAQDADDWEDLLDAVQLAMRHFPDDADTPVYGDVPPSHFSSAHAPDTPRVVDASDLARELAVGMLVLDESGAHVGQLVECDRARRLMVVAPHLISQHDLYIPFDLVYTVDPESMRVRLTLPTDTLHARFASPPPGA
jgi:CheY-like chemotaxis protein